MIEPEIDMSAVDEAEVRLREEDIAALQNLVVRHRAAMDRSQLEIDAAMIELQALKRLDAEANGHKPRFRDGRDVGLVQDLPEYT